MKQYGAVDLRGLTGATATTRWVGGTTAGPPTTGTFAVGDFVIDQTGADWVCTAAGSPGTWLLSGRVLSGTFGSIPTAAAANAGMVYFATDVIGGTPYRSNGSTWVQMAAAVNATLTTKGDLATFGTGLTRLPVGTAGELVMPSTGAVTGLAWTQNPYVGSVLPVGGLFENMPRWAVTSNTLTAPASGVLRMVSIWLPINLVVADLHIMTGTTALSGTGHSWAALYDNNRNLLRQSANDTTPTAGANTVINFTLTSSFTTTYSGHHYLGFMWVASVTQPTLSGVNAVGAINWGLPYLSGTSSTGLTTTAPNPAGALTATALIPYVFVG